MRIAINGFGRIGKNIVRAILDSLEAQKKLHIVAINVGPADPAAIAYALKYDTLLHTYPGDVVYKDGFVHIGGYKIQVFSERDPLKLPWCELKIDWVVEASGAFTHARDALKHCEAGAQHVLITAPAKDDDVCIVPGVNDGAYDHAKHSIVSLGSCTTNALMPMLKVLNDAFVIEFAQMTTVHAYTNSQELIDVDPGMKDPRKSRAAALNIIPTSTGAQKMVDRILPELTGKVVAGALRVPVADVSLVDLTFSAKKPFDAEQINSAFDGSSKGSMKGIVEVSRVPLVSSDYHLNSHSVIIDATLTSVSGNLGKVFGWYDNEWGYSCRLRDFLLSHA